MAGLLENCFKLYHVRCLYEVLGIRSDASPKDVKKAYYKLSLKVHPDRANEKNEAVATEKFQVLGKVYSILSDPEKRKVYDETGSVDDEEIVQERDWEAYWKLLFKSVTLADIENFKKKYQGSEEEQNDLKESYILFKGDMDRIMDHMLCADTDDEPRLTEILWRCIRENEIPDYPAFTKESKAKQNKRKRRYAKEAAEAEELKRELGLEKTTDNDSLVAAIAQRQSSRAREMDDFFTNLEAKYGNKDKKAKSGKTSSTGNVKTKKNSFLETSKKRQK